MKLEKHKKELLKSFENGEWQTVNDINEIKTKLIIAAKNTLDDFSIELTLSPDVLSKLKIRSMESGLSLQLLMTKLINDFSTGKVHFNP